MKTEQEAMTLAATSFPFRDCPELEAWRVELEAKYPGRSYAVLHLTSVSLMLCDMRVYAFAEVTGRPQADLAEQCLASQTALVKALQALGIEQDDFRKSGQLLFNALMLYAQPEPGSGLN